MGGTMRIAVFGAGGVGGNIGGRLAQAGTDVTFIARGEHLRAMQSTGLRLSGETDALIDPVRATDDPGQVGVVDVILVAVKAWQVADAAHNMVPMVGDKTVVVPLCNGLDGPSTLASVVEEAHVLGGRCGTVSYILEPGHVYAGGGTITIGEMDKHRSPRAEPLLEQLCRAGIVAKIADDIHMELWLKLATMSACSGIGSVTHVPAGIWRSVPESRQLYEAAVAEAVAVAAAEGVTIPETDLGDVLSLPDRVGADWVASMQRDMMDGKPSELEDQIGAVVRHGREACVPTPTQTFIYHCLLPLEKQARGDIH